MARKASGGDRYKIAKLKAASDLLEPFDETPAPLMRTVQDLGPPPNDVVGVIAWTNKLCALTLWQVVSGSEESDGMSAKERLRMISEYAGKIGLTSSKAVYDDRIARAERASKASHGTGSSDSDGLDPYPSDVAGTGGTGSGADALAPATGLVPYPPTEGDRH